MKTLVAIDGSPSALRAAAFLIDFIQMGKPSDVHLLNVQPPILSGEVRRFVTQQMIDAYHHEEGEAALRETKQLFQEAALQFTAVIKVGHFAETITEYAKEEHCDSLVMGTRGMGPIANMVLGSITNKVLHLIDIPTTLVNERFQTQTKSGTMRILLPVDGSPNSGRAVRYVIDKIVPDYSQVEILLCHVQPPVAFVELMSSSRDELIAQWSQSAGTEATRSAVAALNSARVPFTLEFISGYPGETIAQYANRQHCQLIVMGTRGMGTVASLVLGSVATKVIHTTDVPVTLIK